MSAFFKKILIFLVLCSLGWTVHRTQSEMDRGRDIRFENNIPEFLPNGDMLRWFSMGYTGLVSDWLWIRSVLYFGRRVMDEDNPYFRYALETGEITCDSPDEDHADHSHHFHEYDILEHMKTDSTHQTTDTVLLGPEFLTDDKLRNMLYKYDCEGRLPDIYQLLDRVTTVDPNFVYPYIFGGVYMLHETGEVDSSYLLLERGWHNNPDNWQFPFYIGWTWWIYKYEYEGYMDSTNKYLEIASKMQGCPNYVKNLHYAVKAEVNPSEVTRMYLQGILENTEDERMKEKIQKIIDRMDITEQKQANNRIR